MKIIRDSKEKDFETLENNNQIIGEVPILENSQIVFYRENNNIYYEKGFKLQNTKINFKADNGLILLGANKNPYILNIATFNDCSVAFGRNNHFNGVLNLVASERCNVLLGNDCLTTLEK